MTAVILIGSFCILLYIMLFFFTFARLNLATVFIFHTSATNTHAHICFEREHRMFLVSIHFNALPFVPWKCRIIKWVIKIIYDTNHPFTRNDATKTNKRKRKKQSQPSRWQWCYFCIRFDIGIEIQKEIQVYLVDRCHNKNRNSAKNSIAQMLE